MDNHLDFLLAMGYGFLSETCAMRWNVHKTLWTNVMGVYIFRSAARRLCVGDCSVASVFLWMLMLYGSIRCWVMAAMCGWRLLRRATVKYQKWSALMGYDEA